MSENTDFWEGRYDSPPPFRGRPTALLVAETADLTPGTALDLGCGQGADAIWLAQRGWQVTAVDVASSALGLAAAHAEKARVSSAITFERHDLAVSSPAGAFDLVTTCYLHSPEDMLPSRPVLERAVAAVAPGGVLLIIGHAGPPFWNGPGTELSAHEQILTALSIPDWTVDRSEIAASRHAAPKGSPGSRPDLVLRLSAPR